MPQRRLITWWLVVEPAAADLAAAVPEGIELQIHFQSVHLSR
jgi:hypothetical protein